MTELADPWYPPPATYWVPAAEADQRPFRYGDLFKAPDTDAAGTALQSRKPIRPWHGLFALSPSCELVSKASDSDTIEVARVRLLTKHPEPAQAKIVTGWQEESGQFRVAFAHTLFLPPVPGVESLGEPMFVDLKQTTRVRMGDLRAAGRIAALDHDARVHLIRRHLYYQFRWLLPLAHVYAFEANRIINDPHFAEPRPDWGAYIENAATTGDAEELIALAREFSTRPI